VPARAVRGGWSRCAGKRRTAAPSPRCEEEEGERQARRRPNPCPLPTGGRGTCRRCERLDATLATRPRPAAGTRAPRARPSHGHQRTSSPPARSGRERREGAMADRQLTPGKAAPPGMGILPMVGVAAISLTGSPSHAVRQAHGPEHRRGTQGHWTSSKNARARKATFTRPAGRRKVPVASAHITGRGPASGPYKRHP